MTRRLDIGLASVARLAGVSTATVSNALNRPHMVSEPTRARVQAAIDELSFVPNRAAATLRQGRNRLLGLVVSDIVNPFYAAIVDAVAEAADRERYTVALCVSHDDPERELRHFNQLAEQRAAGALVVPIMADHSRLTQLRAVGTRLILVDRRADDDEMCSVSINDVLGGELAVRHLLTCRGEGITLVNGRRSIPQCEDRREGARAALSAAGEDPEGLVELEVPEMTIEEGIVAGERIARSGAPRRIFCINDQLAVGVLRGLARQGLASSEVSVVGYGDLQLGADEATGLTTVGQPKQEMGEAAVARLMAELTEGPEHKHAATTFEPQLLVRTSTSPAS
jgi:LacI family transcriptional regulator